MEAAEGKGKSLISLSISSIFKIVAEIVEIQIVKKNRGNTCMRAIFDDSLITGNKTIDGHHQELIDKINKLIACCEAGNGKEEARKMLKEATDQTDKKR